MRPASRALAALVFAAERTRRSSACLKVSGEAYVRAVMPWGPERRERGHDVAEIAPRDEAPTKRLFCSLPQQLRRLAGRRVVPRLPGGELDQPGPIRAR